MSEIINKVNTLRNILVGKFPDPQRQVEQITLGLMYKFMNDMDNKSLSWGGKKHFFKGSLEEFSWDQIKDAKNSSADKLNIFKQGIGAIANEKSIEKLFRDIFSNIPSIIDDPKTFNDFFIVLDQISYENSEDLGAAYEHLLKITGSQGELGQFRTPRHIIDFIVELLDPKPNEKILDPACGTAGFLISAYKNILTKNISPEEKINVSKNIHGYDIEPGMIKASLVNMYLHSISNPKISEYDTLSDDSKWNEYYDLVLANPPFFTPKGGIKPHNRFALSSTKAEILFTSYINEHLTPKGRAAIIVPEGILFKKNKDYVGLRKSLINESLVGIVSLPRGVFKPYTPAKTYILFLNKLLFKKTDQIFYYQINNDGFSLGDQRLPIKENDLPGCLEVVKNYLKNPQNNKYTIAKKDISKNKKFEFPLENHDVNFKISTKYPTHKLSELAHIEYGTRITKKNDTGTKYDVYGGGDASFTTDRKYNREDRVVIGRFAISEICVRAVKGKFFLNDSGLTIKAKQDKGVIQEYLDYVMLYRMKEIYSFGRGVGQKNLNMDQFKDMEIPIPPEPIQEELIASFKLKEKEMEALNKEISKLQNEITQILSVT